MPNKIYVNLFTVDEVIIYFQILSYMRNWEYREAKAISFLDFMRL